MSKRQWIWLIVAAVVFIGLGAYTAWRNNQTVSSFGSLQDMMDAATGMSGFPMSDMTSEMTGIPMSDYIARVDIEGTIMSDDSSAGVLTAAAGFSESYTHDYIDRLMNDPDNVGILLFINSGGGEIKASDEIYLKLMDYKEATGRPIYAYFDATACSGAYYIAMAADEIWANRNCVCVNIGVYIETYNLSGLFEKYGIEEVMIKSSENKGIGAMGHPWTDEQLAIYQSIVDLYYDQFLDVVADGRGMTKDEVRARDDGREMLAAQALEAGFIDGIGRYDEYLDSVLARHDGAELYEEMPMQNSMFSLFDLIYGKLEALVPTSDIQALRELSEAQDGIVVMAYAR